MKRSDTVRRLLAVLLAAMMVMVMAVLGGCSQGSGSGSEDNGADGAEASEAAEEVEVDPTKDIIVLYTSDIHCGIDQNWGFAGLQQIRDNLRSKGTPVLLVDNGDAIQGEAVGMLSNGKAVADLMNSLKYDVIIPGNHEFDYGMDNFMAIAGNSVAPYISCNFMYKGDTVFEPYIVIPIAGKKIGFVGVTTPATIMSSTPTNFQDKDGNFIYSFLQEDDTGAALYDAIQKSVNAARADGADYVVLLAHLGMGAVDKRWDYASVAENTTGIDAILDGHSHDYEQVQVKNKDGQTVVRSACGTKLKSIGWLRISAADGSMSTGRYDWNNDISAPELMGLNNDMSKAVASTMDGVNKQLDQVIAKTTFDLTIYDPEAKTDSGEPIRIVRNAETNLGDLITDALRDQTGADIAMVGGGAVRTTIPAGDITRKSVISVMPFNNDVVVSEVTGQQILDALEWGARNTPGECGCFMQVSGMSYEIDPSIGSSCKADKNGMFAGVEGEYRVGNVKIGDEPLDLEKKYTVASQDFFIKDKGDGLAMFSEKDVVQELMVDNEAVMNYITDTLGGVIPEEYADPYGQGRIVAVED